LALGSADVVPSLRTGSRLHPHEPMFATSSALRAARENDDHHGDAPDAELDSGEVCAICGEEWAADLAVRSDGHFCLVMPRLHEHHHAGA
jgi:hypothetical protein